MDSQSTQAGSNDASDEAAIRDIPAQMIDAWNNGSGADFAAAFSATADFVAFDCSHLKGRSQIAAFHQEIFDTLAKGTQLAAK